MHVERFSQDFSRIMAIEESTGRAGELAGFLQSHGYLDGARSAENILLIQPLFPVETLHRIVVCALLTPSPDMALNTFERLATVIHPADLIEISLRKKSLAQFLLICGSSSFLVSLIFKTPDALRWLFLENGIDLCRSSGDMLAELRRQAEGVADFTTLLKTLRCFKRAEILRIASRDLNGLAPLEEVTAELSSLAAASLQVAHDVCLQCQVREHGLPLMLSEGGPQPAEMTVIGMGKLGGNELNFSSDIDIIYFYGSDKGET